MFRNLIALTLLAFCLCSPLTQATPAQPSTMTEMLNSLPVIRVFIASGARGNGHESTAATIIQRLRQLGYQGPIEAVVDPRSPEIFNKLKWVLPPKMDDQLTILSMDDLSKRPMIPLAIKGADDSFVDPISAAQLKARVLISLKPPGFLRGSNYLEVLEPNPYKQTLSELDEIGYHSSPPRPTNLWQFLNEAMEHDPELSLKIRGLEKIVSQVQNGTELLAVYGFGIYQGSLPANERTPSLQSIMFGTPPPLSWQLQNLLKSLERAQTLDPKSFHSGIIVSIINQTSAEFEMELTKALAESPGPIDIARIDDPQLEMKLEQLHKGEILVVLTGAVTKPVFEYLFANSTLPPVVQGRNSIDFMHGLGLPYLTSSDFSLRVFYPFFPLNSDQSSLSQSHRAIAQQAIDASLILGNEPFPTADQSDQLARFIIEARQSDSAVRHLFSDLSSSHQKDDKLSLALKSCQSFLTRSGRFAIRSPPTFRPYSEL